MQLKRYSDFSMGVQHGVGDQRIPLNGAIELTLRCPLTCAHCYNNLPMDHYTPASHIPALESTNRVDGWVAAVENL